MLSLMWRSARGRVQGATLRSFFISPPSVPSPAAADAKSFFASASAARPATTLTPRTSTSEEARGTGGGAARGDLASCQAHEAVEMAGKVRSSNTVDAKASGSGSSATSSGNYASTVDHDIAGDKVGDGLRLPMFLAREVLVRHAPGPAKLAAKFVAGALNLPTVKDAINTGCGRDARHDSVVAEGRCAMPRQRENGIGSEYCQEYAEHCVLGWSPNHLYRVVADVSQYSSFLPWCVDSTVHQVKPIGTTLYGLGGDAGVPARDGTPPEGSRLSRTSENGICSANPAEDLSRTNNGTSGKVRGDQDNVLDDATVLMPLEMLATLTVGFSFITEKYTSRVLLTPNRMVKAFLSEDEKARRSPILSNLKCVWEFGEVPNYPKQVEVRFCVGFAFRNPIYSKLIMSHVVSIMTRSFERRCEALYGPPSCSRRRIDKE
ncbi:putative Polyketide cyclase dehydrase and lipid transport [Trypanosoma vivax]|nr:putative Polyketide cyclase dehydrase and lipid transport [Trypanosoma vivax]